MRNDIDDRPLRKRGDYKVVEQVIDCPACGAQVSPGLQYKNSSSSDKLIGRAVWLCEECTWMKEQE